MSLSNAHFKFGAKKLIWKSYITAKALSIGKKVKLMNKYEFVAEAPDENSNIFAIHVVALRAIELVMSTYLLRILLVADS